MTVEDIFMQHLSDPELSKDWIWSQLVEAGAADSTRNLHDIGAQFHAALERDDCELAIILRRVRFELATRAPTTV